MTKLHVASQWPPSDGVIVSAPLIATKRGITGLTVKKRGIRLDEDQLRKQLKIGRGAGDGDSATVVLTRVGGEQAVFVVEAS